MSLKKLRRRYEQDDERERHAFWAGGWSWAWGASDYLLYLLIGAAFGVVWLCDFLDWRLIVVAAAAALAFLGYRVLTQHRARRRRALRRAQQ